MKSPHSIFKDTQELLDSIKKADAKTREIHGRMVTLERAIFLSWWCDRGSCSFCYMSTQRDRIRDKARARRRRSSILAEAELLRRIGWRAAFVSGGYGAYSLEEIRDITEQIGEIMGAPTWLNVGVLSKEELSSFSGIAEGVVASVETLRDDLREKICPGKPIEPMREMLTNARDLGLKTGITVILGLGEGPEDLSRLIDFVEDYRLDKVTVYSLNPHESTPFSDSAPPSSLYQAGVIAALRLRFPELKIVAGTWIDQLPNIGIALLAGANGITKYPLYKMFGNRYGKKVEDEILYAGREIVGTFTDRARLNNGDRFPGPWGAEVEAALKRYIRRIES